VVFPFPFLADGVGFSLGYFACDLAGVAPFLGDCLGEGLGDSSGLISFLAFEPRVAFSTTGFYGDFAT
jgi:hypothetical protein